MRRSARRAIVGVAAATDPVAGSIQSLFWPSGAGGVVDAVRARLARGQRAEIHAGDAGAGDGAAVVSSVPAFHYARAVGRRAGVAPVVGRIARAPRRADPRRYRLSQTGHPLGRGVAAVLGHARQDWELPGRGHGGVVDGRARVAAGRRIVFAGGVADSRSAPRSPDSCRRPLSRKVAPGAHPDSARAHGGHPDRHDRRRCGLWRWIALPDRVGAPTPDLHAGRLVESDPVGRAAERGRAALPPRGHRGVGRRTQCGPLGGSATAPRLAARDLATGRTVLGARSLSPSASHLSGSGVTTSASPTCGCSVNDRPAP